jgi:hypothetical protein
MNGRVLWFDTLLLMSKCFELFAKSLESAFFGSDRPQEDVFPLLPSGLVIFVLISLNPFLEIFNLSLNISYLCLDLNLKIKISSTPRQTKLPNDNTSS